MFKFRLTFSDGDMEESEEAYETSEAAENGALEWLSGYDQGGEDLYLSNPGDYPDPEEAEDVEITIYEV